MKQVLMMIISALKNFQVINKNESTPKSLKKKICHEGTKTLRIIKN